MKAAFVPRVNLVTQVQVAEVVRGRESLELGKPMKKLLACSALKGTSQHLNKVIRENSCVLFFVFPYLLPFQFRIGLDHNL